MIAAQKGQESASGSKPNEADAGADSREKRKQVRKLALAVATALTVTVLIVIFQDQIRALSQFGYPGVFVVSFLSNATVVFPAPGLAFTFAMGSVLNPLFVGLVAGAGEALGEIVGYAAGSAGSDIVSSGRIHERLERFTRRYGTLAVFVLAVIPAGLFDFVGLVAGAMRMSVWRFLLAAWLGKTTKTLMVAYAGLNLLSWVLGLFR
mgnify:FL=1